jgi:hypothetical protein
MTQNTDLNVPAPVDSSENAVDWLKLFVMTCVEIRAMLDARVSVSQKHYSPVSLYSCRGTHYGMDLSP